MIRRPTRRWWFASLLGLLAVRDAPGPGATPPPVVVLAPGSIFDQRLEPIRHALVCWESRQGPERAVVDQVCLVPDLPTFLEAISAWDRSHYFPILIDDVESSTRFIRAFRPARIVRLPRSAAPIAPGEVWRRAVEAVGASWTSGDKPGISQLAGDRVPIEFGPTPPGVVLSEPDAPMLAGAVALAAGRFQPLLRLDSSKRFADLLSADEVDAFGRLVARKVAEQRLSYEGLGDDCDFLTIAGDYPFRCRGTWGEPEAVDDRIGRVDGSDRRWAFAGRLLGDPAQSVYRAMCSLFLQPESALMFNAYDEAEPPWADYLMRTASLRLSNSVPTSHVSGEGRATLEGWHEAFDPSSGFGLVLINSHGSPHEFHLRGGPAHPPDIPRGVPSVVVMNHSYSAAEPNDPSTIAGRWLANGAFVFYGSMNEPFLDAFRTPRLVGELIGLRIPLVAALRQLPGETRAGPWRLVYLGDPLYRIERHPRSGPPARLDRWEPTSDWPSYRELPRPRDVPDLGLLAWSRQAALARLQDTGKSQPQDQGLGQAGPEFDDLAEALLSIRREALPAQARPVFDALLTEVLLAARRRTALKARLLEVPEAERTPAVRRTIETLLTVDLHFSLAQDDPSKAQAAWLELMKTATPAAFKAQATTRVGRLARTPARLRSWRDLLTQTLRDRPHPPDSDIIAAELKRVAQALPTAP